MPAPYAIRNKKKFNLIFIDFIRFFSLFNIIKIHFTYESSLLLYNQIEKKGYFLIYELLYFNKLLTSNCFDFLK